MIISTSPAPADINAIDNAYARTKDAFRMRRNANLKNKNLKDHFYSYDVTIFNGLGPMQIIGYLKTIEAANCIAEFANLVSYYTVKFSLTTRKALLVPTSVALGEIEKPFVPKYLVDEFFDLCDILTDPQVAAEIKSSYRPAEMAVFMSELTRLLNMLSDINQYPAFKIIGVLMGEYQYTIKVTKSNQEIGELNRTTVSSNTPSGKLERCIYHLRRAGYAIAL